MCWITLTPTKNKTATNRAASDCSSAEIVRVRHSPKPRFSEVSISLPSTVSTSPPPDQHHHHHRDALHLHAAQHLRPHAPLPHGVLQHHHRRPHLHPIHPLHLHPLTPLHGHGKQIRIEPTCPPVPPTRNVSRCRDPPAPCVSASSSDAGCEKKEPVYRTQIVEPAIVRAETGRLLREARDVRVRGRMRRVGGYEVLGKSVPWDWDCVSSTVASSVVGRADPRKKGKAKRKGGLKYPPFGRMERWM
ncbi:hypothetical protein E8E11_002669 [Didymella keratinophila]|nr:hypothetical protein E8E11_002669 [Didymella keratinophila]